MQRAAVRAEAGEETKEVRRKVSTFQQKVLKRAGETRRPYQFANVVDAQ
jgi:hypothetical protein